jgi:hypothetical protein
VRRAALAAVAVALAGLGAGCGKHLDHRTGPLTLERAVSRGFKRAYAASYRMTTGHGNSLVVRHADVRCRPTGSEPTDQDQPWHWFCRVRYYFRRDASPRLATYGVNVDRLGCFQARSGQFLARIPERVLGGHLADNPLLYIRSCP